MYVLQMYFRGKVSRVTYVDAYVCELVSETVNERFPQSPPTIY